jgi:hypothetical protein
MGPPPLPFPMTKLNMPFQFIKTNSQILETGLQILTPSFFSSQFLEAIARNQFLSKFNVSKHGLRLHYGIMMTPQITYKK